MNKDLIFLLNFEACLDRKVSARPPIWLIMSDIFTLLKGWKILVKLLNIRQLAKLFKLNNVNKLILFHL